MRPPAEPYNNNRKAPTIAALTQLSMLGGVVAFVTWGTSYQMPEDLERHPMICVLAFVFVATYLSDRALAWWVEGELE